MEESHNLLDPDEMAQFGFDSSDPADCEEWLKTTPPQVSSKPYNYAEDREAFGGPPDELDGLLESAYAKRLKEAAISGDIPVGFAIRHLRYNHGDITALTTEDSEFLRWLERDNES